MARLPSPDSTLVRPVEGRSPVSKPAPSQAVLPADAELPRKSRERYTVLEEHARGGLGRIYRVRDSELGRELALKEILVPDVTARVRFAREALITARLEHPAIVPVHEAGCTHEGELFYTMKLVEGRTLLERVASASSLSERLALLPNLVAVADAVAYAHSQGVLHRDLKPSNIMLGDFGETVVLDWGVAKDLRNPSAPDVDPLQSYASASLTLAGTVVGTPGFMPPEQASSGPVDERTDVYALGALLYHLLTRRAPHEGSSSAEVLQSVRTTAPHAVAEVEKGVPKDLAAIVTRAMARDPAQRYPGAREFASELRRYLAGQTVEAHRYSAYQLLERWLRRHRAVALASVLFVVIGAAGIALLERGLRRQAERERTRADASTLALLEQEGRTELASGHPQRAAAYLVEALRRSPEDLALRYLVTQAVRPIAAHLNDLTGHTHDVVTAAYSPDGKLILTSSTDKTLRLWDARTGAPVRVLTQHTKGLDDAQFSPDGARLVSGGWDRTVRVFSTATGEQLLSIDEPLGYRVAFTPDGTRLVAGGQSGEVHVRDAATGALLATLKQHQDRAHVLTFTPDGQQLVVGSWDGTVSFWDLKTYQKVRVLEGHESEITSVAFSRDGKWAAIAEGDTFIHVRRADTWEKSHTLLLPAGARYPAVSFGPEDATLIARTADGCVRLWHASSGQLLSVIDVQTDGKLFGSALSPDGTQLTTVGLKGAAQQWSLQGAMDFQVLPLGVGERYSVYPSEVSRDGARLFVATSDGQLRLWDAKALRPLKTLQTGGNVFSLAVGSGGANVLATTLAPDVNGASVRELETGKTLGLSGHAKRVHNVAVSADGKRFATASYDGTVRTLDAATAQTLQELKPPQPEPLRLTSVAFHPKGEELAVSNENGRVFFFDLRTGRATATLDAHSTWIQDLEYSHDGERLLTSGRQDHVARVWNRATLALELTLEGHKNNLMKGSFSPDDRLISTVALDHTARVWDARTGRLLRTLEGPGYSAEFTPDGRHLFTTGVHGYAVLWDLRPDQRTPEQLVQLVAQRSPWLLEDGHLRRRR